VVLSGLAVALAANAARAQTPEGTVITNIAVVSWTDANGNTYTPDSASVQVTVGFAAGIDVIAALASVTPATPSVDDTLSFDIGNIGNGTDSVTVSEAITDPNSVISVTAYRFNSTNYGSLAALNAVLAGTAIAAGNSITIQVIYDVAADKGGLSATYQLTGTSRRDNGVSDADQTTINPPESLAVSVTPDGGQNLQLLPSNGTNYTFQFTVTNDGDGTEDFDLRALFVDASDIAIVSVDGVAGDSTRITLAPTASQNIDVVYSVLDVAAGTQDTVYLRARSVTGPGTAADSGFADLTVIRPALTITKEACDDSQVCPLAGNPVPGDYIQYRVRVTNNGTAAASSVVVTDDLPTAYVTFDSTSQDGNWSSISYSAPTVTANLSGTLAGGGGTAYFWIRVRIN
jgi:uncharacterized repeat protein (TIGR01451 family)